MRNFGAWLGLVLISTTGTALGAVASSSSACADATLGMDGRTFFVETTPPAMSPSDGTLPSDLGPVSIEASRRAIQANITDWLDSRSRVKTPRALSCGLAGAEAGFLGWPAGALATFTLLNGLDHYLKSGSQAASAPLNTPLAELSRNVAFTEAEHQTLQRLMDREVQDVSDRIRLAIDTQSFLMKVSTRLYQIQIDYHFKRTEGFAGFFRADPEYCAAFSLVTDRDNQLIAAANRVLDLYAALEIELKD